MNTRLTGVPLPGPRNGLQQHAGWPTTPALLCPGGGVGCPQLHVQPLSRCSEVQAAYTGCVRPGLGSLKNADLSLDNFLPEVILVRSYPGPDLIGVLGDFAQV